MHNLTPAPSVADSEDGDETLDPDIRIGAPVEATGFGENLEESVEVVGASAEQLHLGKSRSLPINGCCIV